MAFDITNIKAQEAAPVVRKNSRSGRDLGPNPWLNKDWNQGLWESYEADVPFSAQFPGKFEMVPAKRGEKKGEPIEKLTGDAADAVFLIRQAAVKLGIGVAVPVAETLTTADGKTQKAKAGHVWVTWHGRTRKQKKAKPTAENSADYMTEDQVDEF